LRFERSILFLVTRVCIAALLLLTASACSDRETPGGAHTPAARNFLLVTVDTMRADRLGAYGDASARTPVMDTLAARGARFTNAFAVAPITLPSHASLLTGRYPPGHGSRHNGMRVDPEVPTLAGVLAQHGFATAAFVAAFPLDRRFGLNHGFETYGDQMPRGADGRTANERPGAGVIDEARAWLEAHRGQRFFLWVHLFEPHAPYGDARSGRSVAERYGDEIAEADRQIGRLLERLREAEPSTLIAVASDHGEAFGEHGEIAHSIFVYDTTLRVPWILAGPGLDRQVIQTPVSLVDLAPTVLARLGAPALDTDGIDLGGLLTGRPAPDRTLYAESFAPLLDFGWSPLRTVRAGGWKYIAAPSPELYHVADDRDETRNALADAPGRATSLAAQVARYSSDQLPAPPGGDREAEGRLRALGYASGSRIATTRADPKDRRALAARIGQVTSGELHGVALERVLRDILEEDQGNPLANLRLGFVLLESRRCAEAVAHFRTTIEAKYPSADPHLGLAACQASQKDLRGAADTLRAAEAVEPGNPVVLANLGLMLSDGGNPRQAIGPLERALRRDPDLHQARFGLAVALARDGRRTEAAAQAQELLRRLPADAPQRGEVQRLLAAVK
jgi:arylsulfatase A-like enzyme/Flp pilus assembly protein TadD